MNVIHIRACGQGGPSGMYLDSTDRGPEGKRGIPGEEGEKGETGDTGTSVIGIRIDDNDHLIAKMSNDKEIDAGEMPKIITRRVCSATIDGTTQEINLGKSVNPARVPYILINGLVYTEGFSIDGQILKLELENIPKGKLEVFTNTHSRAGDVDVPIEIKALTEAEIIAILDGEEVQNG